jgi:hypothetical protein
MFWTYLYKDFGTHEYATGSMQAGYDTATAFATIEGALHKQDPRQLLIAIFSGKSLRTMTVGDVK